MNLKDYWIAMKGQKEFMDAWVGFIDMRVAIGKPTTRDARKLLLIDLKEISGERIDLAVKIMNQSIKYNYIVFYPLKPIHGESA